MLDELGNNSIIICPRETKKVLLKQVKKLVNIKFLTINELLDKCLFSYDERAILYVIKNYSVRYEIALEYLDNIKYISNIVYDVEKLNFLKDLKNDLVKNDLLIFDDKFKEYIKDKKVFICNYNLSKFEKYALKDLDIEIINNNNKYIPKVYDKIKRKGFTDIEDIFKKK